MSARWLLPLALTALTALLGGCATVTPPRDVAASLLEAGEAVTLRIGAQLMHGHDMTEPSYDSPQGYQPIPIYQGELLLTDRRLLFVAKPAGATPEWVSIPYAAVARARPSETTLLNYIVVWDGSGHPDSFLVNAHDVQTLHRAVGRALMSRTQGSGGPAVGRHSIR